MSSLLSVEIESSKSQVVHIPMSGQMWDAYHAWVKDYDHADFDYLCDLIRDRVASRISFSIVGAKGE
jgi:hypothetical protein